MSFDENLTTPGASPFGILSPNTITPDALGLSFGPHVLAASSFTTIFAFGDSLSDAGNDYAASFGVLPSSPPYSAGRFSNGNVWVQDVAQQLGLPSVRASLNGGNDFAYGGAETGQDPLHSALPIDLPTQLLTFEALHLFGAPAHALYTLSIGANDLLDAIPVYATNPTLAISDETAAVHNEVSFITSLIHDGAKNFLVLNIPDLGKTPEETSQGAATAANATLLASMYNTSLSASLTALAAQDHVSISVVDTFSLLDMGIADPARFHLTNVTDPVWTGNYYNPLSGHLNAHGSAQYGYLFFDQLHPTSHGHQIIATDALQTLNASAMV